MTFPIILLAISIGLMCTIGSIYLSQKLLPERFEAVFFGGFLIAIAGIYLAFTAYFGRDAAWSVEIAATLIFIVLGSLGTRIPVFLILGYAFHGGWDLLHELQAHTRIDLLGGIEMTSIPLAYGVFCATYDWCMSVYFYRRRDEWRLQSTTHSTC